MGKFKTYKIAITTGDKKGIGKELVEKSLKFLNLSFDDVLIIGEKIASLDYDCIQINEKNNGKFCFESLKLASELALKGMVKGIVTSPVSKYELHKSGFIYNGQTEVLEEFLSENKTAQMVFIANDLKVMLLTRHLALKDIKLNKNKIIKQIEVLNDFLIKKYNIENPKIALCALNPHCGEGGILGKEEKSILEPVVKILQKNNIDITSPQSADSLFAHVGWEFLNNKKLSYDCIVSCYHDQGLAPLKALAFDKAINTTIGLDKNIIRTSPSSGTAYDIAGKNIANPQSMIEAIKLAVKLTEN